MNQFRRNYTDMHGWITEDDHDEEYDEDEDEDENDIEEP